MKIKVIKNKYNIYICLIFLILSVIAIYDLSFKSNIITNIKNDIHYFLIDKLDLPERTSFKKIIPISKTLISKSINLEFEDKFEELFIDIKFKHVQKIKKERERALVTNLLEHSNYYPAKIIFNNENLFYNLFQ